MMRADQQQRSVGTSDQKRNTDMVQDLQYTRCYIYIYIDKDTDTIIEILCIHI